MEAVFCTGTVVEDTSDGVKMAGVLGVQVGGANAELGGVNTEVGMVKAEVGGVNAEVGGVKAGVATYVEEVSGE